MPVRTIDARRNLGKLDDVRVIVVEDNEMIMKLVTHMLGGEPGVAMTPGGSDVLALMDPAIWDEIDVALVDLLLPRTTGDELLEWLAANAPHVRRIAMSGSGPLRLAEADAEVHLLKPFMLDDLLDALRA